MYKKPVWVRFYENPPVPQEAAVALAALRKNKKRRQQNFELLPVKRDNEII